MTRYVIVVSVIIIVAGTVSIVLKSWWPLILAILFVPDYHRKNP